MLVDGNSLASFPEELRGHGGIDLAVHLGCDIFLLNGWGSGIGLRSPELRWGEQVETVSSNDADTATVELRTPAGALTSASRNGHPVKYAVDSLSAVRVYRELWESATFAPHDDRPALAEIDRLLGDAGVATRFWGPTAIPRLLELDMGTENFYYLLHDHRAEMEELIALMHAREHDAFRCLAAGPWDSVTLVENTSTLYVSPDVYRTHSRPHHREFADVCHAAGKVALLHMCGHVRDLLADVRETGCDGIHALTPPPVGNTPWEDALDVLGDDAVIIGAFDPETFARGPVEEIGPALDALYTPRLRGANVCLCCFADGIRVGLDRFEAVADWFAKNG